MYSTMFAYKRSAKHLARWNIWMSVCRFVRDWMWDHRQLTMDGPFKWRSGAAPYGWMNLFANWRINLCVWYELNDDQDLIIDATDDDNGLQKYVQRPKSFVSLVLSQFPTRSVFIIMYSALTSVGNIVANVALWRRNVIRFPTIERSKLEKTLFNF